MFFLKELWLPMLLSAALCSIISGLAWSVMPHHRFAWKRLPTEPDVLDALRKDPPPPGLYAFPFYTATRELDRADVKRAFEKGPVGFLAIANRRRPNPPAMMLATVLYFAVTSIGIGYIAWLAAPGTKLGVPAMQTARIVFSVALLTYAASSLPDSIWFGRPWRAFFAQLLDAALLAAATASLFATLWPS